MMTTEENAVPLEYEKILHNPPYTDLGITKDDYLESLDCFRLGKYMGLEPIPEILGWFQKYGNLAHHVALTATPLSTARLSAEWVMNNFGKWIRTFSFIPSPRKGVDHIQYDKDKIIYCARNSIKTIVEDNVATITEAKEWGMNAVIVSQPWNSSLSCVGLADELERLSSLTISCA